MDSWTLTLAAWVGTYLLHSTVLLVATWWILRWWRALPDHGQETLWRVALFGGFLTATLQLNLGLGPDLGRLELPVAAVEASALALLPEPASLPAEAVSIPEADTESPWLAFLVWVWAVSVCGLAAVHLVRRLRLRWLLSDRTPVLRGRLALRFAELVHNAGLPSTTRLTTSRRIRCPMAFGILRPEVCLPTAIARDMDFDQQGCVLAHELAHLRARDPIWLLLETAALGLGFLQPLNRLASRRLHELAEYRCDAWAVRHGGSDLNMAQALMAVAESYLSGGEPVPAYAGVNAMALGRSALSRRVERIFTASNDPGPVGRIVLGASVVLALAGIALAVPGVSFTKAERDAVETEEPVAVDPRQRRLRILEKELHQLQAELAGIRDSLSGSLQHPDVLAMLSKLEHRVLHLQAEQKTLWREAVARSSERPHNPSRR